MLESSLLVCCKNSAEACVELTPREFLVSNTISESNEPLSFSQLKQSSSLHQEILSRILRRLTVYHVIKKVQDGKYEPNPQCSQ